MVFCECICCDPVKNMKIITFYKMIKTIERQSLHSSMNKSTRQKIEKANICSGEEQGMVACLALVLTPVRVAGK